MVIVDGIESSWRWILDFVELEMKAGGFLDFAVELKNPVFPALAESAGILGLKAETAQDVRPMLQKAFEHDGPALVEALVLRRDGQDRNTAAMVIIKSIDQIRSPGPQLPAHGQTTGQMRFRARGEGSSFFMPHWNPLNIIPGAD
jgi:hypothetical protein